MKDRAAESPMPDLDDTGEYWSKKLQGSAFTSECCWREVPEVGRRRALRETGGSRYSHWAEYCVREFLAGRTPVHRMLSVGCGTGALERTLARLGAFRECDAWDIAAGAVEAARGLAREEGFPHIHYAAKDITLEELPPDRYGAVWFENSLHHIAALEEVCAKVATALEPRGYLFLNEYIGPARFAFPPRQRELVRAAFALIPARLRRHRETGTILTSASLPTPAEVEADDPTESVRSSDIPDVVASYFDIVAFHPSGGSLLQFLLNGIAGNFRDDDPESMRVIDMLLRLEDSLLEIGELQNDFAVLVARPRRPVKARPVPKKTKAAPAGDEPPATMVSVEDELAQKRAALDEAAAYARRLEEELGQKQAHADEVAGYARSLETQAVWLKQEVADVRQEVGELYGRLSSLELGLGWRRRPKVYAVIVHHRGRALLEACLERLLTSRCVDLQVVVVSNACEEPLPAAAEAPPVHVVHSEASLGFSAANNLGVAWAQKHLGEPHHWLFLNNDAGLDPDTICRLAEALDITPRAGVAGPQLRIWGAEDYLNSLGLNVTMSGEAWDEGIGVAVADYGFLPGEREVLAVTGSVLLIRAQALRQIGGWNEIYGFYMEDIDLCLQAWSRGWKVLNVPSAMANHAISATAGQITDFKRLLSWRNQLVLVFRHWPLWTFIQAAPRLVGAQVKVFMQRRRLGYLDDARLQIRAWTGALRLLPRALAQRAKGGGDRSWTRFLRRAGSVPAIRLPAIPPGSRPWEQPVAIETDASGSNPERSSPT